MCIICIEFKKELLNISEARRNMSEMTIDDKHRKEIEEMLNEADQS